MLHAGRDQVVWFSRGLMASRYIGVSQPHLRRKDCGWVAQKKALGLYKARFSSDLAAATWLADQMKVPVNSLRPLPS